MTQLSVVVAPQTPAHVFLPDSDNCKQSLCATPQPAFYGTQAQQVTLR